MADSPTLFSRLSSLATLPTFSPRSPSLVRVLGGRLVDRVRSVLPSSSRTGPSSAAGSLQAPVGRDFPRAALEIRAMEAGLGPWSFVLSWYCVGLVCMGLLFNRIHHIVRPPAPSFQRSHLDRLRQQQHPLQRTSPANPFHTFDDPPSDQQPPPPPLTASQTVILLLRRAIVSRTARKLLRLPSTLLLLRVLVQLAVVLAQTTRWNPARKLTTDSYWARIEAMEMDELCWRTFGCVCFALVTGSIGRGLDGTAQIGTGFNLFGFAFLLHLYSSPLTHLGPAKGTKPIVGQGPARGDRYIASRPDAHVVFGITLAVCELFWTHLNEWSSTLARMRLVPTTVCGLIGLVHFTVTLLRSPTRLPSFTFLTNLLALVLLIIIALTAALNALTQLLTLGTIVPSQLLPPEALSPHWNDEFSLALLKAGTACMESSKLGGLGNEVTVIELPAQSYITLTSASPLPVIPSASSSSSVELHHARSSVGGFANLIPRVHPASHAPHLPAPSDAETPWWKAARRFARSVGRWLLGLAWAVAGKIPGGRPAVRAAAKADRFLRSLRWSWTGVRWVNVGEVGSVVETDPVLEGGEAGDWEDELQDDDGWTAEDEDDVAYARFLEETTAYPDDQDEQDDPSFAVPTPFTRARSASIASSDGEPEDALDIYSHLPASPNLPPTVLLAHMTATSPLTRRRYAALLAPSAPASEGQADDSLAAIVRERRRSSVGGRQAGGSSEVVVSGDDDHKWEEERRRMCVVCVSEEREVILWPCACLALCDGCRSNLASRVNAGSHTCPTCRSNVEGYSRIYIP